VLVVDVVYAVEVGVAADLVAAVGRSSVRSYVGRM
jgi:hypothetical protein